MPSYARVHICVCVLTFFSFALTSSNRFDKSPNFSHIFFPMKCETRVFANTLAHQIRHIILFFFKFFFSVSGISSADSSCKKSGCVRNSRIFRFTCLLSKLGLDTGYTVTEDELLQIVSVDLSEFEDKSTGDNPMYEDV